MSAVILGVFRCIMMYLDLVRSCGAHHCKRQGFILGVVSTIDHHCQTPITTTMTARATMATTTSTRGATHNWTRSETLLQGTRWEQHNTSRR